MYQFTVSAPKNIKLAVKFIREHSDLSVHEASLAIKEQTPAITLDYSDAPVEIEFSEWSNKVTETYKQLNELFASVVIGYSASKFDMIEYVTEEQFFNLLASDIKYYDQEPG